MSMSSDSEVQIPATGEGAGQSEKVSTALPRRSFVSDMPDRGLFALFAIGGFALIMRTVHSPFGQVLKAIKENEPRAISLGYDVDRYKLLAFVLSAA